MEGRPLGRLLGFGVPGGAGMRPWGILSGLQVPMPAQKGTAYRYRSECRCLLLQRPRAMCFKAHVGIQAAITTKLARTSLALMNTPLKPSSSSTNGTWI